MSNLRELQRGFSAGMQGHSDAIHGSIDGRALGAAARLAIYRNAIAATRLRALRDTFPAVCALVGDTFFEQLADRYADRYPSRCGDLCAFGAVFPQFIAQSPEAIEPVPYLADVARLEWLRQEAALAAGSNPDSDRCRPPAAVLESADPQRSRTVLHPSLRTIRSAFPVISIRRWCDTPSEPAPHLDDGPQCGLIWRSGDEVIECEVHAASLAFVEALGESCTIFDAAAAGWSHDTEFDATLCLEDLLTRGLIVDLVQKEKTS